MKHMFNIYLSCVGRNTIHAPANSNKNKSPDGLDYTRKDPRDELKIKIANIMEEMKLLYKQKVLPLESQFRFGETYTPSWADGDFDAKPMILLLGQYSTGKTTFIQYLINKDFPGSSIGPEPTTDKFVAVMHGNSAQIIPGHALVCDNDKPFTSISKFGSGFMSRFQASLCQSPILKDFIFIDTPGVLSGEKQGTQRTYDFLEVTRWFADRSDRIILLFDAHQLDINDQFKEVLKVVKNHNKKIHCVLNKADMPKQHLLRVYGALMWSLGKIIPNPEALRVCIGSFCSKPIKHVNTQPLIISELRDLKTDLQNLSRTSTMRRMDKLVKRIRMLKMHVHIVSYLKDQFGWWGKKGTQNKFLENLETHFEIIQNKTNLPKTDFPAIKYFQKQFRHREIWNIPKLNPKAIEGLDILLSVDIPRMLKQLEEITLESERFYLDWDISKEQQRKYDNQFFNLALNHEQKVEFEEAKKFLIETDIQENKINALYELADIDQDDMLDNDEFAVLMFVVEKLKSGELTKVPEELEHSWIPPSKMCEYEIDEAESSEAAIDIP